MRRAPSLRKDRRGSALIEFAMLSPIFFLVVAGLTEFVLYQFKVNALNHIAYEAGRNLQTGEVQRAGDASAQLAAFQANICAEVVWIINCTDIDFDVRNYSDIEDITFPATTYDAQGNPTNFVFQPGGASRFSVVKASVHHSFVTPYMGRLMGLTPDLPAVASSYVVLRNEPWT
jgi:Flp pilus assembly protein TadG